MSLFRVGLGVGRWLLLRGFGFGRLDLLLGVHPGMGLRGGVCLGIGMLVRIRLIKNMYIYC